jgi:hypothetical protein
MYLSKKLTHLQRNQELERVAQRNRIHIFSYAPVVFARQRIFCSLARGKSTSSADLGERNTTSDLRIIMVKRNCEEKTLFHLMNQSKGKFAVPQLILPKLLSPTCSAVGSPKRAETTFPLGLAPASDLAPLVDVRAAWVDLPRLGDHVRRCWLCVLLPARPAGRRRRPSSSPAPPPASLPPLLSLREYKWAVAFPRPTDDWALGSQTLNGSSGQPPCVLLFFTDSVFFLYNHRSCRRKIYLTVNIF